MRGTEEQVGWAQRIKPYKIGEAITYIIAAEVRHGKMSPQAIRARNGFKIFADEKSAAWWIEWRDVDIALVMSDAVERAVRDAGSEEALANKYKLERPNGQTLRLHSAAP